MQRISNSQPRAISRRSFAKACLAAGAAAVFSPLLSACSSSSKSQATDNIPRNSYDWTRLTYTAGRAGYTDADGTKALCGIDVSEHDGTIDWNAVAADGIDFAIIRAAYRGNTLGEIHQDECFSDNIAGAISAGLPVGLYCFSQAITTEEAIEEAEYTCSLAAGFDIAYPIVYDLEEVGVSQERIAGLSVQDATDEAIAFCKRVKELGFKPSIYGNDTWLDGHYSLETIANAYDLWLADYNTKPDETYQFAMWQYTNKATVNGIETAADLSLCFKSYAS